VASTANEQADKKTAARWLGRDPDQIKIWGSVLRDALSGNGVLLKLNTYETRLFRQSQQLLAQFLVVRKARAPDFSLEANPLSADDEIRGTSEVLSPNEAAEETGETRRH
jgi:hypothetical protein